MAAPLVSIVIASYNHARFLPQAIESVWQQTESDLELIVVDDGSSDDSVAVISALAAKSPLPMRVETQSNAGPAATLDRGLRMARGKWFCILASDDFYAPDFIAKNLREAERLRRDDMVFHSNAFLVEGDGRVTGTMDAIAIARPLRGQAFDLLANGGGRLLPCTMFIRRDVLIRCGGFDPTMLAEDCDLQLRLARKAEFHYIEEPIFYSRHTPGSLGKKPWLWGDSIIQALAKHEDILGSRLPGLLSKASASIATHCVEHGGWPHALHWARQSVRFAPGPRNKATAAGALAWRIGRAAARNAALRLFGRSRLVRLKRALQRV